MVGTSGLFLLLMLQTAAGGHCAGGVDSGTAFFDRNNLSFRVDNECGAIGQIRRAKHAIFFHHITFVVGKHGEFGVQLLGPVVESRYEIAANG